MYRHGLSQTSENAAWRRIQSRCMNPSNNRFKYYGGAGVRVCKRWQGEKGFINFLSDVGPRPSPAHSIGRFMDMGDYKPGNCKWMSSKEQGEEKRKRNLFLKSLKPSEEKEVKKLAGTVSKPEAARILKVSHGVLQGFLWRKRIAWPRNHQNTIKEGVKP